MRLTAVQLETARAIVRSVEERGFVPTLQELAERLGLRSVASVHGRLESLEAIGGLLRRRDDTRGFYPTKALIEALKEQDDGRDLSSVPEDQLNSLVSVIELADSGFRVTASSLAPKIHRSVSAAHYHLRSLTRRGLVARRSFPRVAYNPTPRGRAILGDRGEE